MTPELQQAYKEYIECLEDAIARPIISEDRAKDANQLRERIAALEDSQPPEGKICKHCKQLFGEHAKAGHRCPVKLGGFGPFHHTQVFEEVPTTAGQGVSEPTEEQFNKDLAIEVVARFLTKSKTRSLPLEKQQFIDGAKWSRSRVGGDRMKELREAIVKQQKSWRDSNRHLMHRMQYVMFEKFLTLIDSLSTEGERTTRN